MLTARLLSEQNLRTARPSGREASMPPCFDIIRQARIAHDLFLANRNDSVPRDRSHFRTHSWFGAEDEKPTLSASSATCILMAGFEQLPPSDLSAPPSSHSECVQACYSL